MRIVMTQTLDLPEEANLWDMSEVSTIVVTQRGARRSFQKLLASKGVEVVEFDILNPREVMEYFHDCGYLSILWECGGTLAASAISSGVIHKVWFILSFFFFSGKNLNEVPLVFGIVRILFNCCNSFKVNNKWATGGLCTIFWDNQEAFNAFLCFNHPPKRSVYHISWHFESGRCKIVELKGSFL